MSSHWKKHVWLSDKEQALQNEWFRQMSEIDPTGWLFANYKWLMWADDYGEDEYQDLAKEWYPAGWVFKHLENHQ